MKNLPSITIITCILDCHIPTFKLSLNSIRKQKYPKELIEHLVMDGGSTNEGPDLARRHNCSVIVRKDLKDQVEARVGIAIKKAKGDMILMLQSDNILTSSDWLLRMVEPFTENKEIFCTFSMYNSYFKHMFITTRYCALFGSHDPFLYYLNRTEKIRMNQNQYDKGEIIKKNRIYYTLQFNKNNLPPFGDNGHMFIKNIIKKVNKNPAEYLHTDAFSRLIELGYNTFGAVNNSIIHVQKPNIIDYLKSRIANKETFYDKNRGKRKYLLFNWHSLQDQLNLIRYVFLSCTFIVPLIESVKGYRRIRDKAWFLHPLICFLIVIVYGLSEIKCFFKIFISNHKLRKHLSHTI